MGIQILVYSFGMQKEDWTLNIGAAVFYSSDVKTVISFTCILNLMLLTK
jgi:hypothetical protein